MVWLTIKLLIELQKSQKLCIRIIQKELQINMIKIREERQKIMDGVRLIWQYKNGIPINNNFAGQYAKPTIQIVDNKLGWNKWWLSWNVQHR